MKRSPIEIALVVAGILLLVLLTLARQSSSSHAKPSLFSTYDTGRNGYRALYDVLQRERVPTMRFERELGLLPHDVGTLVISSVQPETIYANPFDVHPLTDADVGRLKTFVRNGGRLVTLDTEYGGAEDAKLGFPGSRKVPHANVAIALADVAFTADVTRVRGAVTKAFPFATRKATPLLATPHGAVAIAYPFGKGEIVAITAPSLFSNANLASDDNARFALNVLSGHGTVAFDERVHGFVEDKSFWGALPAPVHAAVWIVLGIVLFALFGANVRFAPPLPPEGDDERDSSAYVTAMAGLMRRAHAARAAISAFADDALQRVRRRYGLPPTADAATIAARTDRDDVRRAIIALERLHSLDRPGDDALVRAAAFNARLRKELS